MPHSERGRRGDKEWERARRWGGDEGGVEDESRRDKEGVQDGLKDEIKDFTKEGRKDE